MFGGTGYNKGRVRGGADRACGARGAAGASPLSRGAFRAHHAVPHLCAPPVTNDTPTMPRTPAEFSWEDVKSDKFRENYLGNSLMAPVGRWMKGKDLTWYSRGKRMLSTEQARREELDAVKREEEQAMMAALCVAPAWGASTRRR